MNSTTPRGYGEPRLVPDLPLIPSDPDRALCWSCAYRGNLGENHMRSQCSAFRTAHVTPAAGYAAADFDWPFNFCPRSLGACSGYRAMGPDLSSAMPPSDSFLHSVY